MAGPIKEIFGADTDDDKARQFANGIAALLNSKALPNDKVILGEAYCPFKVSFHTKAFHCFFFVSDASYSFTAKPRPKTPWVEDFRVSLKAADPVSGTRVLSSGLSKRIGVKVYRLPRCPDDATDVAFSVGIMAILAKIQFNRIQQFNFSPVRLEVSASLDSPEFCVNQALLFQELVTLANHEAFERNKSSFD